MMIAGKVFSVFISDDACLGFCWLFVVEQCAMIVRYAITDQCLCLGVRDVGAMSV